MHALYHLELLYLYNPDYIVHVAYESDICSGIEPIDMFGERLTTRLISDKQQKDDQANKPHIRWVISCSPTTRLIAAALIVVLIVIHHPAACHLILLPLGL